MFVVLHRVMFLLAVQNPMKVPPYCLFKIVTEKSMGEFVLRLLASKMIFQPTNRFRYIQVSRDNERFRRDQELPESDFHISSYKEC